MTTFPVFEERIKAKRSKDEVTPAESLGEEIKRRRLSELDEAELEVEDQRRRAKIVESQKKEAEAQTAIIGAQSSMMDKVMPSGFWSFMAESFKDRSPSSAITVNDVVTLIDKYTKLLGPAAATEQPSEGMWGFLSSIMSTMKESNQPLTASSVIDIAERFQRTNNAAPPSPMSQMKDMADAVKTFKDVFAPPSPPQAGPSVPSVPIDIGGGNVVPWATLKDFVDHQFNLALRKEEHEEKQAWGKAIRENVPGMVQAVQAFAAKGSQTGQQAPQTLRAKCGNSECGLEQDVAPGTREFTCKGCGWHNELQ